MTNSPTLRGWIGATSRWNPHHPEIGVWRSELALNQIREDVAQRLLDADRRKLGCELLGIDCGEGVGGS